MFVGLHNHTMYSLLDATSKPEDIVKRLQEVNQNAIAITEHGNMYSAVVMYKELTKHKIKMIYGCEMYICDDMKVKDKNNRYHHLVVLAYNEAGRLNLNKLVSIANIEGFYYKPRIDFNILSKYKDGLIILSACMAGEVQKTLASNDMALTETIIKRYKQTFGENYYLEIQSHRDPMQLRLNKQVVELAKKHNIKWVVTTDSHYVSKEDQKYHSIYVNIGQTREVGETYNDCYIQSEEEIRKILSETLSPEDIDLAINNTVEIANKCDVKIPLSPPLIPHADVPAIYNSEMSYLKALCEEGWKKKKINLMSFVEQQKRKERLDYELNAIDKMGFAGYFLLVKDYTDLTEKRGLARGSAGGSFVSYLLDIVKIDPIKYTLLFERFIDVHAVELLEQGAISPQDLKIPDIDVDFGVDEREEIVKYLSNKYGNNRVAGIGTFQYNRAKGTIKDIGRVLGIPFEITNAMTKEMSDETIEQALSLGLLDEYKDKYPELFEYAQKLSGLPKSFSIHASGKIIAMDDLTKYTPITESNGEIALQCDMRDAESLGLVKIDLLGLRTIDVISDTLQYIGKDMSFVDIDKINLNDQNVYENIFQKGNTDGIFQFESSGMKDTLKKIKPVSLNDLAVANALYRPGAKKYIDNYARRKDGTEAITYIHDDLKPILSSTYGILVYQEQLIEIGRLAQLENPDLLRKATAKKKQKLLEELKPKLAQGLKRRNWTDDQIEDLWNDMVDFGKYSFNKSHAVGYAATAYICAYLKHYYPVEFMCSSLNSYKGKMDKISTCCNCIKNMNINIVTPTLQEAYSLCEVKNNEIHYGISLIKNCNDDMIHDLNKIRDKQYTHFLDVLYDMQKTIVDARQLDILIRLDFFQRFGKAKKLLNFVQCFNIVANASVLHKNKIHPMFQPVVTKYARKTPKQYRDLNNRAILEEIWDMIPNEDLSVYEKIKAQQEYLGFVNYTDPTIDKRYVLVLNLDTTYSPKFTGYCLNNGKTEMLKIHKQPYRGKGKKGITYYKDIPFQEGDLLYTIKYKTKPKSKKTICPDGKEVWVNIPNTKEWWLEKYTLVF